MRSAQHEINRLRAEFLEMPGLRLTTAQAQRLCGLDGTSCRVALESLVNAKFLNRDSNGAYARLTEGGRHRAVPARRRV